MATREEIANRVAALLAKAESTQHPEEAALLAAKATELMDRYDIGQAILDELGKDTEPEEEIIDTQDFGAEAAVGEADYLISGWYGSLLWVAGNHLHCCPYSVITEGKKEYHLVGRPSDIDATRYLFGYLLRQIQAICKREGKGKGVKWRNEFRSGCIDTIYWRLTKLRDEQLAAMRKNAKRETGCRSEAKALVVIDTAIDKLQNRKRAVEEHMDGMNLKETKSRAAKVPAARAAGQIAGEEIDLPDAKSKFVEHRDDGRLIE